MANIYSFQLGRRSTTTTDLTSLGVVPPGEKWVVKNVCVVNGTGTEAVAYMHVCDQGDCTAFIVVSLAPNTTQVFQLTQVLEAGAELFISSSLPSLAFSVGGYRFLVP